MPLTLLVDRTIRLWYMKTLEEKEHKLVPRSLSITPFTVFYFYVKV